MGYVERKYDVATTILFPMRKVGSQDFANTGDWTPVAGDVKVSKDEGAFVNTTNLPNPEGSGMWSLLLTGATGEMTASRVVVSIIDAATKTVEDQSIIIDTYGNAAAQHAFDRDKAINAASGIVESNLKQINGDGADAVSFGIAIDNDSDIVKTNLQEINGVAGAAAALALAIDTGNNTVAMDVPNYTELFRIIDGVYLDVTNGSAGTSFPVGSPGTPSNDIDNAVIIAAANKVQKIYVVIGDQFTSAAANKKYIGSGGNSPGVNFNGKNIENSTFEKLDINGTTIGDDNLYLKCTMGSGTARLGVRDEWRGGVIESVGLEVKDDIKFVGTSFLKGATIDLGQLAATDKINLIDCYGDLVIQGSTAAITIEIKNFKGKLELVSNITAATIDISGFEGELIDGATGGGSTVNLIRDDNRDAIKVKTDESIVRSDNGTLTGGPHTVSSVRTTLTEVTDDHFNNSEIRFTTGVLKGQSRFIKDYVGATKDIVPKENFTDIPADGDAFDILPIVDTMAAGATALTRTDYVDFMTKKVIVRTAGNPTQYEVGTGPNKETIDVTFITFDTVEKADTETVA